jgi:hypothetical protein
VDTTIGIAFTSFLVGLSGAMMPGPVLTVTIGETAVRLLSDLAWYGGVSLTLALGHRMLSDGLYRSLVTVCAGFPVGFGLSFSSSGLSGFWV